MTFEGECICCGQRRFVELPEFADENAVNQEATLKCKCPESLPIRQKEEVRWKTAENIEGLFSPKYAKVTSLLLEALPLMLDGHVQSITVNTGGRVKATMKKSKTEGIKVEKIYTEKDSLES